MFNDLIKIVFIVSNIFLCATIGAASKIPFPSVGEEKKEVLAPVKEEKKIILASVEEEEEKSTEAGTKAATTTIPLPSNILVRGDLIITGITNTVYSMPNNGVMVIEPTGAVIRKPDIWGVKMQHPGWSGTATPKKAKIYIYVDIGAGDSSRLTGKYGGIFDEIARMVVPYLSSDLIQDEAVPSNKGWKGIFGVTSDDDDGIRMFNSIIAAYYNANYNPNYPSTLIWDIADPALNGGINTQPDPPGNNFALKSTVATLDPTDPSLPVYDADTAPCGVDAEGAYHIPFGIGCKDPTTIVKGVTYIPSVDIRGNGKVMLEGNNRYLILGTVYIRRGVEAIVVNETSMPQTNINIGMLGDVGTNILTFLPSTATTYTMPSGVSLNMVSDTNSDAKIIVPNFATFNISSAMVDIDDASSIVVKNGGKIIF